MLVRRFDDLIAWQEARKLRQMIYQLSRKATFSRDLELRAQIRAASGSAMTNKVRALIGGLRASLRKQLTAQQQRHATQKQHVTSPNNPST